MLSLLLAKAALHGRAALLPEVMGQFAAGQNCDYWFINISACHSISHWFCYKTNGNTAKATRVSGNFQR